MMYAGRHADREHFIYNIVNDAREREVSYSQRRRKEDIFIFIYFVRFLSCLSGAKVANSSIS